MRNIIIFGHKQHGKDTACEYLEAKFGVSFASSSRFALDLFLFEKMCDESFGYETPEECFSDRVNHRKYWYEAIRDYNTPNKTRLGGKLFAEYDVYCGIRDLEEFRALKAAGLVNLAIFIDASGRLEKEDSESMKLDIEDADIVITNNGTLEQFYEKLDKLFTQLL
ncbi:hypothetical protein [Ralstonia phage RP31]|uniref:Deoxynucleotide monophosphate kinase n=2 Tax=Ripduovirus RP12 TaxID=2560700 RepID=A0A1L7N184_9CAUD|nr:hypothetical protein FDH28_gp169 [Ralstonia phage RP12]BAW19226.1 hypothetical protein [Ralstonia phage RP12]BAW19512.1 hypothetical protein [Ralstonia phage RP31]